MHVHAAKMPVMSSGLKLGLQGFVLFGGLHACSMCEELRSCEDLLAFLFFFSTFRSCGDGDKENEVVRDEART